MNSEQDESAEVLDEVGVKSGDDSGGSENLQASGEQSKSRRGKRKGKKRKQRKDGGAACESETQPEIESLPESERVHESPTWDSDEELDCEINAYNDVIIRPINVPKAPENSTQFIIDDHNECRLYMSFETPNPYLSNNPHVKGETCEITEPIGEDAAYIDIDYEYESPQDFDNSAYYDREFELSYKSNRFDELLRLPRNELISGLHALESRLKELSDDLVKENPSPILEKLQAELLELQEKHCVLKETNSKLSDLVMQNEEGKVPDAQAIDLQANLSEQQSMSNSSPTTVALSVSEGQVMVEPMLVVSTADSDTVDDCHLRLRKQSEGDIENRLHNNLCVSEDGLHQSVGLDLSDSHVSASGQIVIKGCSDTVSYDELPEDLELKAVPV